ncbi:hypothetical protein [Aggregatilinea lenta]|uniref:hypothetical protein n=1 Tax=Aggregatilinea lenta TaxID=913108 RepID=UPI000E5B2969|nr:hypothetical protein [Aggregatilinea lenta]
MSIMDIILEEKMILLAIGAALAPLVIALLLGLVTNLRKAAAHRKAQRAALAAHRAEARALAAAQEAERAATAPQTSSEAGDNKADGSSQAGIREFKGPDGKLAPQSDASGEEDEQEEGEEITAAMQDLLTSVFDDENTDSPYAALLENLSTVETSELVVFADQITALLNSQTLAVADEEH